VKALRAAAAVALALTVFAGCSAPTNDRVPAGATWTQHYFPSTDGVELHADVLLPEDADGPLPVILSAGSYFGHSGELAVEGHAQTGPSERFADTVPAFLERGYAVAMVDTRGFGGSTGCLEFAGPGEQADVDAAITWAATQPWSNGAVGMYGKSYDAVTALLGNNSDNPALKATVAMEPIWDIQRNMRSNGVPRSTIADVSTQYVAQATMPQMPDDDPHYRANAEYEKAHPECGPLYSAGYRSTDAAYWAERDLAAKAKGTDTPLFVTQGFLEWNTEPEGIEEFLANHEGPERGWLGQWDHVRGNDLGPDGRPVTGRGGWVDEVLSFYDEHLKGISPTTAYPAFAVQDSTGAWRAEESWPAVDRTASVSLGAGSYGDDGVAGGYLVRSEPVAGPVRITGTPRFSAGFEGRGQVMVQLYDAAPDGTAVLMNQQVAQLPSTGFELKSTDWTLPAGHSLAVRVGTIVPGVTPDNDWLATPSGETVTVRGARLDLALDDPSRDQAIPGDPAQWQELYRLAFTVPLPPGAPTFALG
jgi:uncharacterized protein